MLTSQTMIFIERISSVDNDQDLTDQFEAFLRDLGIPQYFLGEVRGILPDGVIRRGNWDAEWTERYIDKGYHQTDPIIARALKQPGPFYWSMEDDTFASNDAALRFLKEAYEFDLASGYTVPIFQSNGYLAIASFCSINGAPDEAVQAALELATICFHDKLLSFQAETLDEANKLSDRQRECLHWVASGKSDWEIGEILNISKATVHTHIEKAKRLYEVPTRVQAVVNALRSRELRL